MRIQRGFSLVELLIVVAIIGIIAAIAIPSLLASRRASNEAAAVASLRTVSSAQATYLAQNSKYGRFQELTSSLLLIDRAWTDGCVRNGYVYPGITVTDSGGRFECTAHPLTATVGQKSYSLIEDYVIRFTSGLTAPASGSGTAIGS